jgi:hypothetical protein
MMPSKEVRRKLRVERDRRGAAASPTLKEAQHVYAVS